MLLPLLLAILQFVAVGFEVAWFAAVVARKIFILVLIWYIFLLAFLLLHLKITEVNWSRAVVPPGLLLLVVLTMVE